MLRQGEGRRARARAAPAQIWQRQSTFRALLAAHHVLIGRRLFQESAVHHPVDLLLELGRLVALYAKQLRQHAGLALLRLEVAQQLFAQAVFVFAQPLHRAIERARDLLRGLVVDIVAGDDAAAPTQLGDLAA